MSTWGIIIIAFWAAVILFLAFVALMRLRVASSRTEGIKHGRGVFMTFEYTPGEWDYYKYDLAFRGVSGKAAFGDKNVYLTDGTENVFIELYGPFRHTARLREVYLKDQFIVFKVRNRELEPKESGAVAPDTPLNVEEFFVLIPESRRDDAQTLLEFYRMLILKREREKA